MFRQLERFDETFTLENGVPFFGKMITSYEIPPYGLLPRNRLLRVPATTRVSSGDLFKDVTGREYFLASSFTHSSFGILRSTRFVCADLTGRYGWRRPSAVIDPVSRLKVSDIWTEMGPLPARIEAENEQNDSSIDFNIRFEKFKIITNRPIKVDDVVDDKTIIRVVKESGLYIADTQ